MTRHEGPCPECGWPTEMGYALVSGHGDEPKRLVFCTNPHCDFIHEPTDNDNDN